MIAEFGGTTFSRGRSYAQAGRVITRRWIGPSHLVGVVEGNGEQPYEVTVMIRRANNGVLVEAEGSCTCPMEYQCKHCVALLLAGDLSPTAPVPTAFGAPDWEERLRRVLTTRSRPDTGDGLDVGLQFEVAGLALGHPSSLAVRPVTRGPSRRWVRTGISWSELTYYRRRPLDEATGTAVGLFGELLGIARGSEGNLWMARSETVQLENVNSRRLWDLLEEIVELGAPLVWAGREGGEVRIGIPAETRSDLTTGADGLVMQTAFSSGDETISTPASLLIGHPAHGIAWWEEGQRGSVLQLARFRRPPSNTEHALVTGGPVLIPKADVERFQAQLLPRLRHRVSLSSSDDSVDLTAVAEPGLILRVVHRPGHMLELEWNQGVAGAWQEELGSVPDAVVEAAAAEAAGVVDKLGLARGGRLAHHARLSDMDAVVFLNDLLPALSSIEHLEVDLSDDGPTYRPATEAPKVRMGGSASSDGDWFDLAVEVSVGGEPVVFHDLFTALAQGRSHLILPSGTYFSLDAPELAELARLIAEARRLQDSDGDSVRLSRYQASLWDELGQLGVFDREAAAWAEAINGLINATGTSAKELPAGLQATLRPYQVEGFRWLWFLLQNRLGGILADDMGLGKTLQALALVGAAKEEGAGPFLVVAPTSVVGNWVSECHRFAPDLKVAAVEDTARRRGAPLDGVVSGADLVITSYALFRLDYQDYERRPWAGLLLDEAQFIKNSASHAYRRARTLPVPFKLAMTGTPMENNLMELWSLLSVTAPGLFPRSDHFAEYYRLPIERGGDEERLAQLRKRIRPLMLRRTKEQVASELPAKSEQVLELDLEERHRRIYQTYLQRERQKVLGLLDNVNRNRVAIFQSLTVLRQASLHVALVDDKHEAVPSTKLDSLMGMLEEVVADGHRVLVFSQFTRFLSMARQRITEAGINHCYLDGRTRKRAEVIDRFRTGGAPVFLISLKAGGFGLNLTEADYCILLDPWWNPAAEAQAVDRAHRIGQTRNVMVYRLVARDTIEEKVMALKAKKAALFANIMDAGDFASTGLSSGDIRVLLEV